MLPMLTVVDQLEHWTLAWNQELATDHHIHHDDYDHHDHHIHHDDYDHHNHHDDYDHLIHHNLHNHHRRPLLYL